MHVKSWVDKKGLVGCTIALLQKSLLKSCNLLKGLSGVTLPKACTLFLSANAHLYNHPAPASTIMKLHYYKGTLCYLML